MAKRKEKGRRGRERRGRGSAEIRAAIRRTRRVPPREEMDRADLVWWAALLSRHLRRGEGSGQGLRPKGLRNTRRLCLPQPSGGDSAHQTATAERPGWKPRIPRITPISGEKATAPVRSIRAIRRSKALLLEPLLDSVEPLIDLFHGAGKAEPRIVRATER